MEQPRIYTLIDQQIPEVKRALPEHLKANAASYARSLTTLLKQTPKLAECDPYTILGGLMTASQLGLDFSPLGLAYMVPYGQQAQLIIGYRGIINLAYRSGQLKDIDAHEVKENDYFEYEFGLEPRLVHRPNLQGVRGRTIGYYGVAHMTTGGGHFTVQSMDDIQDHRNRSKSKNNGPWVTDFDAMARKTCIRVMQPYLPLTTNLGSHVDGSVTRGTRLEELETEQVDWIDAEEADPETGELPPAPPTEGLPLDDGRPFTQTEAES